jgi:hypothetical protein
MKKTFYLLIVLFFISACELIREKNDYDYDSYTIKNDTEYTVNIMAYDRYYTDVVELIDDITIEAYDNYYVERERSEVVVPKSVFAETNVDSVVITFNNSKRIIYICNDPLGSCIDEPRSIIYRFLYEQNYEDYRGTDYIYTLTQEDYDNAELIE